MELNRTVRAYIKEEVERQGHVLSVITDGGVRVVGMEDAWRYAIEHRASLPTMADVLEIAKRIEQCNVNGVRNYAVFVGNSPTAQVADVARLTADLFDKVSTYSPFGFYRELLTIHPFGDGNGRTGKVILNWLNGTLDTPIFPPHDFWGTPIRNP